MFAGFRSAGIEPDHRESFDDPCGVTLGKAGSRGDFGTDDDYQASYLVSQAVNELCPAQIWQLRNSAAHYQSPPGVHP